MTVSARGMGRWFRVYEEILDDPKVQRLEPAIFKMWVNILALTSRCDGELPSIADCAFAFRVTEDDVSSAFLALEIVGLLKRKGNKPYLNGWEKRQYISDTSTSRVRAFRERKKALHETPSESESDTDTDPEGSSLRSEPNAPAKNGSGSFAEFWRAYPHKVGIRVARKAFLGALKRADMATMLAAVERYVLEKPPDRPWANPSTWLNQDRWLDQPARAGPVDYSDLASETLRRMQDKCSQQPTLSLDSPQPPSKSTSS